MASIPLYDAPQVDLRPLAAPRQSSVASPEIFNHDATEQAQGARALMAGGQVLADVATKMRERDDADSVFRAETALKDDYLKQEQDWRANKQGRFAKGLTEQANQWWAKAVEAHAKGLDNPNQQRLFIQRAARYREAALHSVSGFESEQLERSHDESWRASKNTSISTAASAATPEAIAAAAADIKNSNRYQAARKGWEPEQLEAENRKDLTALHTQVLQGLVQRDPAKAKEYFTAHKSEIDGAQHAELEKLATTATATALGEKAADEVWKSTGPKYDTEPANQDKMEAEIRDRFKDDEFARKAAIAALRERVTAFDKGRKEREAATESTVWKSINQGATFAQVQRMPEYLKLDGKTQTAMRDYIENRARERDTRRDADLAKKNFAAYAIYSRPDNLANMSEDQIVNLLPELGNTLVGHLLEKKRSLVGKTLQATMDQQDFDHVAQQAGLRPFDPSKNEEQRAQLGELKFRVESLIDAEQQKQKRPLTREEKMALMQREMDNQVVLDRFDLGTGLRDTKKSLIMLTPDEMKDAYVEVDGQRVKLAAIPAEERATIIRKRQERGLPVSEHLIAQTWLRAQQKRPGATK